jgi:DNA polymerase-1
MQNNIVLFDGHNMLFRYFRGMPRTIISNTGEPIHGAYGFVAAVIQHLKRFDPIGAIVCLDSPGPPERVNTDSSYKANRQWSYEGSSENPFSQLPFIEAALVLLRVRSVASDGIEADDLIATIARHWSTAGTRVYVASTDQDLLQLVDDRVSVYYRRGKKEWTLSPAEVHAKFGVTASQLGAWKALVGDPSDNVSGVPGIGRATAAALLGDYESLSGIYANLSHVSPRISRLLTEHRDLVHHNYTLVGLDYDVPLGSEWLSLIPEPPVVTMGVRDVFRELGFL